MKRITLVGMGPGNPDLLTVGAKRKIEQADIIIGAERLLVDLPAGKKDRVCHKAIRSSEIASLIKQTAEKHAICVVMSGDVGLFSGTKSLLECIEGTTVEVIPGISSVQYFAAKLCRPWQSWHCVSAHGIACNPVAALRSRSEVFFVTGGENTVTTLCKKLKAAGFGASRIWVGERLSYEDERIREGSITKFASQTFDDLSVMLVEPCASDEAWNWAQAGIPDNLFVRGATPMTKQEVRATILAKLKIAYNDTIYDVGAGTGSVTVDLALQAQEGQVFAIECVADAVALIKQNIERFAVSNVEVVEGCAPEALENLPAPAGVFIGGSRGNLEAIIRAVRKKNPRVRLCVACVTLETLAEATHLLSTSEYRDLDISQVTVSRTEKIGSYSLLKAQNPIFLVSARGEDV